MTVRIGDLELVSPADGEGVFPSGIDGVFPEVSATEIARWLPLA